MNLYTHVQYVANRTKHDNLYFDTTLFILETNLICVLCVAKHSTIGVN